jgi:hypothetical protein
MATMRLTKRDSLFEAGSEGLASIRELALARMLIGIIPFKSEVEMTTSTQRPILGMKGTQCGRRLLTARTQIHQINQPSLVQEKKR